MADSRALLGEAMRGEKSLDCCARHPVTVWYDGRDCPACKVAAENPQIMKVINRVTRINIETGELNVVAR